MTEHDEEHNEDENEGCYGPTTVLYCDLRNADTAWRVVSKNGGVYLTEAIGWYVLTMNHGYIFIAHFHDASPPVCIAMNESDEYFYTKEEAQEFINKAP